MPRILKFWIFKVKKVIRLSILPNWPEKKIIIDQDKLRQKVATASTRESICKTQPKNRTRNIINHALYSALRDAANLVIILNLAEKCCNNRVQLLECCQNIEWDSSLRLEPKQALKHMFTLSTAVTWKDCSKSHVKEIEEVKIKLNCLCKRKKLYACDLIPRHVMCFLMLWINKKVRLVVKAWLSQRPELLISWILFGNATTFHPF